jgi:hypothetical protein
MKRYLVLLWPQFLSLIVLSIYFYLGGNQWWVLLISPVLVLATDGINKYSHKWLRPIKSAWWDIMRKHECEVMIIKSTPAVARYPMLIWLSFDAKEQYLTLTQKQFAKVVSDKVYQISMGILNGFADSPLGGFNHYSGSDLDYDEQRLIDDFLAQEKKGK